MCVTFHFSLTPLHKLIVRKLLYIFLNFQTKKKLLHFEVNPENGTPIKIPKPPFIWCGCIELAFQSMRGYYWLRTTDIFLFLSTNF
ncbi:hypothetical protein B4080_2308 [Bacillus cereus]|nr:hypothetical protein B4080_2308 [Bacillus cereus]